MPKLRHPDRAGLHLRVVLNGAVVVGPGRADLLAAVAELGSIAAAARRTEMSYRRAWTLLEATAAAFGAPVVEAFPGGAAGGSARLTELGCTILASYRRIESAAARATAAELAGLQALVTHRTGSHRVGEERPVTVE